ncbi:MAG: STAS domain-containing protein [Oceanipulchritudo sp.]|jgi:anti-anti-sigma factor
MKEPSPETRQAAMIGGAVDERKGRLLVEINDDVTSSQVPELRKALLQIIEENNSRNWNALYLDMRNSRMVDSMGMNWLFAETMRLKEARKKVVVRISSPAINRVMQFAGMDKLVTLKFRRRKQTR